MTTLFVSDLHLQIRKPTIFAGFLRFLRDKAITADSLYILGDLFDQWIGDDDSNKLHHEVASAIKSVVNSGVSCFFIHGNHDFLIGKNFANKCGMKLLPEKKVLNLYGHSILIMHGDILYTNDINYQEFRIKMHTPWIQMLFLSLPLFIRNYIANKIRANSKMTTDFKVSNIANIDPKAVVNIMEKHCVKWLIHGHIHNPKIHKLITNGETIFQVTLGSWNSTGSMAKVTSHGVELISFPL